MLTLNLHCLRVDGTQYATNTERFAAIASLVANRDVSALALQEACQRQGENAIDELRSAIEKATATSWSSAWTFAHIAWEGTPDQADEGVGLLVKGTLSNPTESILAVQGSLRRVTTSATLPSEWSNVRLTSVHFEVFEQAARTMQAREVAVAALVDTDPVFGAIVAGDFNDVEGSTTHDAFPALGYLATDAGLDSTGIDHVMIHRATNLRPIVAEKVFLGTEAVSDHPGILVQFKAAAGDTVTTTRLTAQASLAPKDFLAIRGNLAPLSWNLGFPMRQSANGTHSFITTEFAGNFECKTLRNDTTWQMGSNVQGTRGTDQLITPLF
jgi:endonuclease/exonuclease/phosphatase family metal-dependent hydrolase